MVQPRPDGTANWKALWILFAINFAFVSPYLIFATSRVPRKSNYHNVVRIGREETLEGFMDCGRSCLSICKQSRFATECVTEKRMERSSG